jgi:hypothetical protein
VTEWFDCASMPLDVRQAKHPLAQVCRMTALRIMMYGAEKEGRVVR